LLEISGEIKGERLRFVEAMKEATAINVQCEVSASKQSDRLTLLEVHVEHFKQDLSREVMAMTEEVGRLHREKQVIENQISDLFAFYSKHKQSVVCSKYYMRNRDVNIPLC
jgi:prophage DNA circulation protein